MSPSRRREGRAAAETGDHELVRRCVESGCPESFEALMSRYETRLYAVVYRMVSERERAEDLVQEVFLKAWRGLAGFEGNSSFYTWIYRIARNAVASDHRRLAARPAISMSIGSDDGDGRSGFEPTDARGDPRRVAEVRERQRALIEALEGLAPEFKEIILLRDVESHAYEEIAEMLEIPVGTVRSRLHRARGELKARMSRIA